jgi:hypothetical protein
MSWWLGVLIFLGLVIAAVLFGLLVGFIVLRIQKKPWPYSWSLFGNHSDNGHTMMHDDTIPLVQVSAPQAEKKVKTPAEIQEALEEFVKKRQPAYPLSDPVKPHKTDFLLEVEANLAIATSPWTGKLLPFQTKIMDANRGRIDSLLPELKESLTEAYTDMHLANTLVWLSMDVGHRSKDLDESYLKLCNKISERLAKSVTPLTRAGI